MGDRVVCMISQRNMEQWNWTKNYRYEVYQISDSHFFAYTDPYSTANFLTILTQFLVAECSTPEMLTTVNIRFKKSLCVTLRIMKRRTVWTAPVRAVHPARSLSRDSSPNWRTGEKGVGDGWPLDGVKQWLKHRDGRKSVCFTRYAKKRYNVKESCTLK